MFLIYTTCLCTDRSFRNFDEDGFCQYLGLTGKDHGNKAYNDFEKTINGIMEKQVPSTEICGRKKNGSLHEQKGQEKQFTENRQVKCRNKNLWKLYRKQRNLVTKHNREMVIIFSERWVGGWF